MIAAAAAAAATVAVTVMVATAAIAAARLAMKIKQKTDGTVTKPKQVIQGGQPTRGQGSEQLLRCGHSKHLECEYVTTS